MAGPLVQIFGGTTLTAGQVTVGVSATSIIAKNANRRRVVIKNTGAASIFIGPANTVTTTNGHAVAAGETLTLFTTSAIFGIIASATAVVTHAEEAA